MRSNNKYPPKKGGKSRGEGYSSYRITSYLSISKANAEAAGRKNVANLHSSLTDMLDAHSTVATDNTGKPAPQPGIAPPTPGAPDPKAQYASRMQLKLDQARDALLRVKARFQKYIDMYVFYKNKIFDTADMVIDGLGKASEATKELAKVYFKNMLHKFDRIPVINNNPEEVQEGDPSMLQPNKHYVSFVDLQQMNVEFTDNNNYPLFDFSRYKNQKYGLSPVIVDPIATEVALQAMRECAAKAAAIPPAMEGRYANMPLAYVLTNATEDDLQAFLSYVKVYPGNYVARNLKVSETFATWVVYGAPTP